MPMLSIPQIWVYSLVDCWAQIFMLTGYWVGWSSRTRQLIAISLSYFVLPVSCMSRVETNSSNLFPFSDAWIGSSPNHIIWLRMRQFEERLRIFFAIKLCVSGNWESYCLTRCAQVVSRWKQWVCHRERMVHEAECGTPCGGKIPRGFVVLRRLAALHCLTLPWGERGEHISNFEHFECRWTTLQKLGRCDQLKPGLMDFWQHNLFRHYYFSLCIGSQKQKYHQGWRQTWYL